MSVRLAFWHWTGPLIGLGTMMFVLTAANAHGQSLARSDTPPVQSSETGASPAPTAQSPALRKGSPATPPSQGRRRADPESDTPLSNFDSLAAEPDKSPLKVPPPHPLAAAHPQHNVIVCVGGCRTPEPGIVFLAPRTVASSAEPAFESSVVLNVSVPGKNQGIRNCLAGCYAKPPPEVALEAAPDTDNRDTDSRMMFARHLHPSAGHSRISRYFEPPPFNRRRP